MSGNISMIAGGASYLFAKETFVLLMIGVLIGIIAGSIPGLSSSNTTAILLPLTLGMSTQGALIFLAAIIRYRIWWRKWGWECPLPIRSWILTENTGLSEERS